MALAFGFDDDVFEESRVRLEKPTVTYHAKQCEHMWFMKDADVSDEDKLQCLLFRGDALFHHQQWQNAVQVYQSALEMTSKRNPSVRRRLWESIARCYVHLDNSKLAHEFAMKMVDDSQSDEQKMTSHSLLATVYHCCSNYQEEILCLHWCIHYQSITVQFWLRLGKAYLGLSKLANANDPHANIQHSGKSQNTESKCTHTSSCLNYQSSGCQHCQDKSGKTRIIKINRNTENVDYSDDLCRCQNSYQDCHNSGKTHIMKITRKTENVDSLDADEKCRVGVCCITADGVPDTANTSGGSVMCQGNEVDANTSAGRDATPNVAVEYNNTECRKQECGDRSDAHKRTVSDMTEHHHTDTLEIENSALCLCSVKNCLTNVPIGLKPPVLLKHFAMECLIRSNVLLRTVQHTINSFARIKNQELVKEVEILLESLCIDASIIQKVRQLTEDDVFRRGIKSEDNTSHGSNDDDGNVTDDKDAAKTILIGEEFEQKWFSWSALGTTHDCVTDY